MAAAWPSGDHASVEGICVTLWLSRRTGLKDGAATFLLLVFLLPWASLSVLNPIRALPWDSVSHFVHLETWSSAFPAL